MLPEPSSRLILREATEDDAAFMLQLITEPSWPRYIRKHDVSTEDGARNYLRERIISAYGQGLGFWVIQWRNSGQPAGICGLIKRDYLDQPDLGFALLEQYWGQGVAFEACAAVIRYARDTLELPSLLAITLPENTRSSDLLERLGFSLARHEQDPQGDTITVYRLVL